MHRLSRRLVLTSATVGLVETRRVTAEEHGEMPEAPTTGGRRPGPVLPDRWRPQPPAVRGAAPVAIRIEKAAVEAPVEQVAIVDGVMQDPSGPWVVSWYDDLAALGERGNVVMAGHVDYWDVGPAVFWNLTGLQPGDEIQVVAEDDRVFTYGVDWFKDYVVADMTEADFDEMLGDAGDEALTLMTCALGTFDAATGEYRERTVLRATQTA